jgi:hypothetical protein
MQVNEQIRIVIIKPEGYTHYLALYELAETIIYGLHEINVECDVGINELHATKINIIIGAHLLNHDALDKLPANSIIYNTEQMSAPCFRAESAYLAMLRKYQVWDYSVGNVKKLLEKGVNAIKFVPIGYVEQLTRIPAVTEDIDVLFYGSMNERRSRVLNDLMARGFKVKSVFNVYGKERDEYIARSKIVLNVHFYEDQVFEIVRVSYLLANKKAVVAECDELTSIEPDIKRSVAAAAYDKLVDTCARLLADEAERKKIANDGFEIFAARRESSYLARALDLANK